MKIFDRTFTAIEQKLDLATKRHAVLSGNVANNETPNYIARDYTFANEVEKALNTYQAPLIQTHGKHLDLESSSRAHTVLDNSMPVGADGNNVDLDIQMGKISSNARAYRGAVNLLSMKLRLLRTAINGGRGI